MIVGIAISCYEEKRKLPTAAKEISGRGNANAGSDSTCYVTIVHVIGTSMW
jgi:hypothetical protein